MSPTHPLERVRLQPAAALDLMPAVRGIVSATTMDACHHAIAAAARTLEEQSAFTVMAAEIAPSLRQPVILWQAGHVIADDIDLGGWFARASNHPGQLLDFGGAGTGLAVSQGQGTHWVVLVVNGVPPHDIGQGMNDIAHIAALRLSRLRGEAEMRAQLLRLKSGDARYDALVHAAADILWEARSDGVLKVTHAFRDHGDLAQRIAGQRLDDILPGAREALAAGKPLRGRRVTLSGIDRELFLTAGTRPGEDTLFGLIAVDGPERPAVEARILETIIGARQREEQLRRETEVLLLGLRLLLGDQPFREKLEQLAQHIGRAIGCDDIRLLRFRPGEGLQQILPNTPFTQGTQKLERLLAEARILTVYQQDSDSAVFLQNMLGMRPGDIALAILPAQAERYYLFCRARDGLSADNAGVAERISLLLQHAVLMQADQQQMIHASKMSALGQMSTSIAHELRQPLNTISIAAQNIELMLEMDNITPEVLQEKSTRILSQVDRACKVMDRMRRFGRKTAGTYLPVSPAAIARSARSLMDTVTGETGIAIEIAIPDHLEVLADELEIEQVLVNLIQNAADAIQEAGIKPGVIQIRAAEDADPALVQILVADNGPGFPEDVQKRALDAFFTTKAQGKGTGLGLSIAHSILREHGGRLLAGNGERGGQVTLVLQRAPKSDRAA